ncbi:MAG: alkaline phosphatase D family protein [Bdellovibrionota bacterium]
MKLNRRDFLKGSAAVSAGTAVDWSLDDVLAKLPRRYANPFSILQGVTNETSIQLAVGVPTLLKAHYILVDTETSEEFEAKIIKSTAPSYSDEVVHKMFFSGLTLGRQYLFRVISDSNQILDEREVQTLDTQKPNARVALLSCMNDLIGIKIDEMWAAVKASNPDFICLLGDNVYGDILVLHGPKTLWRRYVDTRNALPFYHWRKLVPAIAIWDDHDFGKNNVLGNYEHRENSLAVFNSFYAQNPVKNFYTRGPGISSTCELFGHRFIFMDGRYFRRTDLANREFLGTEQLNWVEEQVAAAKGPVFFCMGSQFFGKYQPSDNSYEGLGGGNEFERFKKVAASANQPILMASGDVHYSEVQQVNRAYAGFDGFEITSSCMHSTADSKIDRNGRRIAGTLQNNFVFLNIDQAGSYQATCFGYQNERFSVPLQF